MIRVLVLVLLAANLLYWGWSQWVREESPRLVSPTPPVAAAAQTTSADTQVCTRVGPIAGEVSAMEIEQLLRDLRMEPLRRTVTADTPDGWWVYVNNADAASQARALRVIQDSGMPDAFAMPDDAEFRISVGLFREEARARSRADAVRALNLDPQVGERMRRDTHYWFELPGVAGSSVDLSRLAAEGVDTAMLRIEDCDAGGLAPPEAPLTPPGAAGAGDAVATADEGALAADGDAAATPPP